MAGLKGGGNVPCGEAGFGLIEVALAITVSSIGVLAAAGVVVGIGAHMRRAELDTDRTLAARSAVHGLVRAGYQQATSGAADVDIGGRRIRVSRAVTPRSDRLRHVRVTAQRPQRLPAAWEILLARRRPLPAAP